MKNCFKDWSQSTNLILYVTVNNFQLCRDGTSWAEPGEYLAGINMSCSRTQHSDAGEAQTRNSSISRQAL